MKVAAGFGNAPSGATMRRLETNAARDISRTSAETEAPADPMRRAFRFLKAFRPDAALFAPLYERAAFHVPQAD
jgi:hypothetical protein